MPTLHPVSKKKYLWISRLIIAALIMIVPDVLFAVDIQSTQVPVDKSPVSLVNVLQIMTYLTLVILIIVGCAWLFRRYGRINSAMNGDLKVVAGLSVGQREKIVLVEVGSVQLLLGVAPGRVQTLHVLEGAHISKNENAGQESFISRFNDEIRKKMLS